MTMKATPNMTFAEVQQLLDAAVGGGQIGAHHAFWRGITRDQFVAKKVFGKIVVVPGDVDGSNLVKALSAIVPFGKDVGTPDATIARMPARMDQMTPENIARIADWITKGCPE
jgi:hypothetical protein